jgi:flavin reductase (DIM6/NTAB) family NADH-FMN oxidoreductase RutF
VSEGDEAGPLTDRADYSLFVVTVTGRGGERGGCLAGFVTQCSIEPVRFIVCVSLANHTYEVAQGAGAIGLHLLGADQMDLASLFGEKTGDDTDKFAQCRWVTGAAGSPILSECAAWFEGSIDERFDVGDHQALLVSPIESGPGPCPGTLTFQHARGMKPGHPADDEEADAR